MSNPLNLKIDPEKIQEIPMVDLAFMVLKAANTPYYYRDLMNEVAKIRGFKEQEINETIAQLYTEINIDGRFACVGTNLWGLKRWYPLERSDDPVANAKRPRIINDEDDDDDFADEEETYSVDDTEEDYDNVDEESDDDIYSDDDDADEEVDEEVVLDDDDMDDEDSEDEDEDASDEDENDNDLDR
ncbi:DNA-directed RNA polymerase subunit delta [Paenibacillus sp. N3/727]|uniref:DNA-directed RNA polymerase subunit delta n=1 Tax=Paenibacillus sp. N3/727 TaxID=2925845 RepID=UPI001F52E0B3|nr:DNA-directed RNA polymerase subunit delta [Paenibacillus sp. N3/727]UNK18594.1 DNA-directed RNA polymerase subunit delta [Paenibacillus sp. N3/727]